MANLTDSLSRITIGIRYQRNFGLLDSTGSIVDSIAHGEDSPFPPNFFPHLQEGMDRSKILLDATQQSHFRINSDDLIFQYSLNEGDIFEDKFNWIIGKCLPYFVNQILLPRKVKKYSRLGVVFSHDMPAPAFINETAVSLTGDTFSNPESMLVRFSKKNIVEEALIKKNVNDWQNVIFTLQKKELNMMTLDIDMQHYFNPFPDDLAQEFDYIAFFKGAKLTLQNKYHQMLADKFLKAVGHENVK